MEFPTFDELLDIDYSKEVVPIKIYLSLNNLPNERWKDIEGYEGLYQISDYGRVKSLPKTVSFKNNFGEFQYETKIKILTPIVNTKGYYVVSLVKNKHKKQFRVHQMVANHFIADKNNFKYTDFDDTNNIDFDKLVINHEDGQKRNNHYSNLVWCTTSYNLREAFRLSLKKPSKSMLGKTGAACPNSIPVNQYTSDGIFMKRWDSARDAMRYYGRKSNEIYKCCKGTKKLEWGYKWRYFDE